MDWFEEWFDSPLYEKLYANRDEQEAAKLVDLLERTLPLDECSKILDLGCGRGRHSITLNREGYDVTGIDLSEKAIKTAREKANNLNLSNIRFMVRDMRDPLPETFDAIVNLFTTFGYFYSDKENASVFDSVYNMMKPGSTFVLDYLNAVRVRNSFIPTEEDTFQDLEYRVKRYIKGDAIYKEIIFSGDRLNGDKEYAERVKLYELPWFKKEMSKRNLIISDIYGDYDGNDFDPETSSRLLIISRMEKS